MRNFLLILVVSIPTVRLQSDQRPPHVVSVGRPAPFATSSMEDYGLAGYPDTADNLLYDFPSERSPDYFVDNPPPFIRRRGRRRYSYPMTRSPSFDIYSRPPMFERYPVRPTRLPYARRPIIDPYYEELSPYDRMAYQPIFRGGFRRRLPTRYRPGVESYPHINAEFEPIVHDHRGVTYTPRSSSRRLPPDLMDYRFSEFTRRPLYARRGRFLSRGRIDRSYRDQRRNRRDDLSLNGMEFPRQANYMRNEIEPPRETFIDSRFSEGSSYSGSGYRHQDYDFTSDYNTPRRSQQGPPDVGLNQLMTRNKKNSPDRPIRDPTSKRRRLHPFTEPGHIDRRNSLTRQQARFARKTDHPRHVRSSHYPSDLSLKRSETSPLSPGWEKNTETSNNITSIQDGFIPDLVNEKPASRTDNIVSKSASVNIKSSNNGISRRSETNKINDSQKENHGSLEYYNSSKSSSIVGNSTKEAIKNTEGQYDSSSANINERKQQYFDIHNILITPFDKSGENRHLNKKRNIGSANTFIKTTPHSIIIPMPFGFDLSKSSDMVVDLTKSIPENNNGQQIQAVQEISQISTPKVTVPAMNTDKRAPFESNTLSNEKRIPEITPQTATIGSTYFKRGSHKAGEGRQHLRNGSTKNHTRHRGQRRNRGSTASNNREASSRPRQREPHREVVIPRRDESSFVSTLLRDDLPYNDNFTRKDRPVRRLGRYLSNSERLNRQDRVSLSSQRPYHSLRRPYEDGPVPTRSQRRGISSRVDNKPVPRRRIAPSQRPYRFSSSRAMGMENRDRSHLRRRFRQYTNETSAGRSLARPSDSTRHLRRPLPSRTYVSDSFDKRSRAGDVFQERQLSPRRTRTDTQTVNSRQRRPPKVTRPRRRLSSAGRITTDRRSDVKSQRHRRLPTRRLQEFVPLERSRVSRESSVIQSSRELPSPRTQYIDQPILFSNESSQGRGDISETLSNDINDILPERIIRRRRRPASGGRYGDERSVGPPANRRRSLAPERSYPFETSEPSSSVRQDFRRDPIHSPRRPYSRSDVSRPLPTRASLIRRGFSERSVYPTQRNRALETSRRRSLRPRESSETSRDLATDFPPYRLSPSRRSSLEESSVAPFLERSGVSKSMPRRASSRRRAFTESTVDPTYDRIPEVAAPRRRPRRPKESREISRDSYPERTTSALRFRSFQRDQNDDETSIPPFPSVDLPQRRIASSERRPLPSRRYDMKPKITQSGERRRIRATSIRPRLLRYRVHRSEVTSLPPSRRRLPARSAIRNGPVLQSKPLLAKEETTLITSPFRKVAQMSVRVNETSSLPRVPTTDKIHSRTVSRRPYLLEQPSGQRRSYPEVRGQQIEHKPPTSQQVSVPSRYNDTIAGLRLGVVRARGGENGFPVHGGFCPGERCADGGLAAGVENGTGTGTLDAFLERIRTGANEDIIAYKRELGSLTII